MKRGAIVQIVCQANCQPSPHDLRYVVEWNPHTPFGTCSVKTTSERSWARVFADKVEAFTEYRTVSKVQPARPTDGRPNRPLTGLTINIEDVT